MEGGGGGSKYKLESWMNYEKQNLEKGIKNKYRLSK